MQSAPLHLLEPGRGASSVYSTPTYPFGSPAANGPRPRRRRVNRRARRIFPLVGLLLVMALGVLWAIRSPAFRVTAIAINGNKLVPSSVIQSASGIAPGQSLWLLSQRTTQRRLQAIPAIEDVQLVRKFPHTVLLQVQERAPWAAIRVEGKVYLVGTDQRVLTAVNHVPDSLPSVVLEGSASGMVPRPGGILSSRPLLAATRCLRAGQDPTYGVPIDRVFIDASHNIWLNVRGLVRARLGEAADLGPKLAMLRTLARGSSELLRKMQYVDLQNPVAPAYTPRTDSAAGTSTPAAAAVRQQPRSH